MEPKTANEWVVLASTVAGFATAAVLFGGRAVRRFGDMRWIARQPWRQLFGEDPAQSIYDILQDLAHAQDILESRQSVACRKLGIGIYVTDAQNGECIFASDLLAEIFGLTPVEMLGFGWASQVVDREAKLRNWEECCRRKITYRDEYSIRNARTEKMVHCRTEAHYVPSGGGRYVGWIEVIIR